MSESIKYILVRLLITILMIAVSPHLYSQGHSANLDKYWSYRHRLVNDFMVVGDGQGMSMPAQQRDTVAGFMKWADNTIWMGWYIGTLALEYYMLLHPHAYPGFDMGDHNAASQTLNELYYALKGLRRLDANAESTFPSPCDTVYNARNGFFIRDDVPTGFDTNFVGINEIRSDFNSSNVYDKEMSQDQVYHVLMGLALVKKFIPNGLEVREMNIKQEAINQAKLIVEWVKQDGWMIKNPVCFDNGMNLKNVARGENAVLLSSGLNKMIKFITDGTVNYDSDVLYSGIWRSLIYPSNPGYNNPDNLHMAMVIAAVGSGWADTTLPALMDLAVKNKWYAYPLLFCALHEYASIPGFSNYRKTMNFWAESMLDEAPASGPYNAYPDSNTNGYAVNNRFIRERSLHYIGNNFTAGSQFPGLDYMLLHNLYYVVSPSKWPVVYDWAPVGATWYYDQDEFGSTDKRYNKFESVGDTAIDGVVARKIMYTQHQMNEDIFDEDFIYTYIDSNKVFYYSDGDFRLLYDFNSEPGDTFFSYCPRGGGYINVVVDSVGQKTVNGNKLEVWFVHSLGGSCYMSGSIVERIGAQSFMFAQSAVADPPWGGMLRCYEDSKIGFYNHQPGKACDFITSIEEPFSTYPVELYPNPAKDIVFLDIPGYSGSVSIEIFNSIGKQISMKQFTYAPPLKMNVKDLQKGIYLLLLTDDNGNQVIRRFVKD